MSTNAAINEFVRRRIRRLRLSKGIKLVELASRLRIPASSYCSMETGKCRISLDHLFRITGSLGVDITDVWPSETAKLAAVENPVYLLRIQKFRLGEIISLTKAEGGALLVVESGVCSILLHNRLSDFLLDRLILYLEDGRRYEHGLWFDQEAAGATLQLFLKSGQCAPYVAQLIRFYLAIWVGLWQDGKLTIEHGSGLTYNRGQVMRLGGPGLSH